MFMMRLKRTPTECRITWIGGRYPRINHAEWSTSEASKLNAVVSEDMKVKKPIDWAKVAETLATSRTSIDYMKHGLPPHRHSWTPEADQKLIKAVNICRIDNWQLVTRNVSEYANPTGILKEALNTNLGFFYSTVPKDAGCTQVFPFSQ
ncbi:hypothetical protein M422DRAFT_262549 [Sphaerobolus stellatus SS14]|uniref:Myb-like domain-containing protein n=1 Tax=Sphaerobolus stellatus (strain SS14) TaxID=990650 RepID=A0A0C9V0M0_SPHS4|nr:hypothetical protein M422DRAFT_262549 [Sphaerobolus stellatus SS14]